MATTFTDLTGDGNNNKAFSFPSYQESDIKVEVDNVVKTVTTHYNITNYTTTGGGTVVFTSGNIPAAGVAIRIYRDTGVDTAKATFAAGSSIKAGDLNNNQTQLLYALQEEQNQTVTTSRVKNSAVTTAKIDADAIDGTKIADNAVDSEHYTDGSIDTVHIGDSQVTTAKIADSSITTAKIADDAVTTDKLANSINTAIDANTAKVTNATHTGDVTGSGALTIASSAVTTAKIADDAVTTDKLANSINTAIDANTAKVTNATHTGEVTGSGALTITADAVTGAKIADDAIDSEHYTDGSIDTAHLAADCVDGTKIVDDAIGSEHIAANAVGTSEIADAELVTLAGMQAGTASILAGGTALTATLPELNLLDGKSFVTSVSGSSTNTEIPSAAAVNAQIVALIQDLGGFVPITNEVSFPNANPDPNNDAGTIVSIADAGGVVVNGSGVSTTGRTLGGATVTINGIDSTLYNSTIAAGKGMLVQTTSTLNTYTYHRLIVDEAGVAAAQTLVTDFNQRYQVAGSTPSQQPDGTALAEGDLWFDTATDKMKVYSGSQYDTVTSVGDYKILSIEDTDGSAADFTNQSFNLKDGGNAANVTSAAQLIVSVNGVIQKPNTGTSAPAEGFAMVDADTIIFSNAPGAGASVFITLIGSATTVNVPADNSVTSAKIAAGAVEESDIADNAVTLGKMVHGTQGGIVYYAASGTPTELAAGSSGYFLKTQGSGANPVWAAVTDTQLTEEQVEDFVGGMVTGNTETGITVTYQDADGTLDFVVDDTTKMPLAGGTFTGDVTWDNGTNTDKDMIWDESDDTLKFNDDVQISLGSDRDMRLYHTGTHAYFNVVTGDLNIRTASTESAIVCTANAGVATYYNDAKKTETTNTGLTVTGTLAATAVTGDGSGLTGIDAGATGGGSDKVFWENGTTITTNYTVGTTFGAACNAVSGGPITINNGVTVTVDAGDTWTIV